MKHTHLICLAIILPLIAGCSSSDSQLAYFAERSADRQAEQNKRMADVTQAASQDHRRIVEAVEKSRQEVVSLEHEVRDQHDRLDEERRSLANERHRESLLAPVLSTLGTLLVAAIPLVLCWLLLYGLRRPVGEDEVTELLVHELLNSEHGNSVPRLGQNESPRLEASEEAEELPF